MEAPGERRGRLEGHDHPERWAPFRVVGAVLAVLASVAVAVGVSAQGSGDCYVGLVVEAGESCTYPGTDVEFRVDDSGSGRLLF